MQPLHKAIGPLLLILLVLEANGHGVKSLGDKFLPSAVRNIFNPQPLGNVSSDDGANEYQVHTDKQEDGSLNSLGRDVIRRITDTGDKLKHTIDTIVQKMTPEGLDTNETFFKKVGKSFTNFQKEIKAIYPGTRWCGDGDKAKSFDDLGTFADTDRCCRSHDKCSVNIPAGQEQYGLLNTGLFTRSHCDCDGEFFNCLVNSSSILSTKIGITYFTILGPQCFKKDHPKLGCVQYIRGKCVNYHLDETSESVYQWFDSPPFPLLK